MSNVKAKINPRYKIATQKNMIPQHELLSRTGGKVLLITHTDLDGVGCALVANHCLKAFDVTIKSVDYNTIEEVATKLMDKEHENYDFIIFSDISPSERIGRQLLEGSTNIFIVDHHVSRSYLQEYRNAFYKEDDSATLILWRDFFMQKNLNELIYTIDAWDSWKLKSPYRQQGVLLNLLFHSLDFLTFLERFKDLRSMSSKEYQLAVDLDNEILARLILILKTGKDRRDVNSDRFLLIESDEKLPFGRLTEMMARTSKYVAYKYVKIVNAETRTISLYSDKIDVSVIAKKHKGGGHAGAAGYRYY